MFRGGSIINLDAKGRLALPTRYRAPIVERYNGELVLTIHDDGCLLLYPRPEWEEIERRLVRLPNQDRRVQELQRMLMGHATDVEMDGHGRILIPRMLRAHAGLEKRVALAGVGNKFEIWREETWDKLREQWKKRAQRDEDEPLPEALRTLTL